MTEPRLTAHMAADENMIQAYKDGKDLYCVIASKVFNNKYEDNLEFYPEGTEIELDGKKIICGHKTHLNKAGKERRSPQTYRYSRKFLQLQQYPRALLDLLLWQA